MLTWIQFNKEQKEDDNRESELGIHKVGYRVWSMTEIWDAGGISTFL